jgi:beta-N-acetylhexosaminidase
LTTVKHFPGHGRTKLDTHVTVPEIKIDYEKWEDTDAKPFKVAIENGVDFVMMGHLIYSKIASEPASLSKEHIQKVRDMGFEGVITTDDLGMLEASDHDAYESLDKAINSGIDMMLYVRTEENSEDLYQHAVESMIKDKKMENRINESVKRILKMKFQLLGEEKVNDQSKD